ncbi:MAG: dethiobiotin synthase [Hydrogenothermaceae bacterium]|nr:dethiobiotin synthase [Hydrogenothermaceae bacterium]
MKKQLFITATDTGVGKTTVSAGLCKLLKDIGVNVGYFKPVETGVEEVPSDVKLLTDITGQPIEEAILYSFKNPLAPYPASKIENKKIDINKIIDHYNYLRDKYDFLIVEGAGGVYVPIVKGYSYVDLIKDLNIPVLLVARAKLGTINHTLLTIKALEGCNIVGIVMNGFSGDDISENTNPEVIEELSGIKVICRCKKVENPVNECYNKLKFIVDFFKV